MYSVSYCAAVRGIDGCLVQVEADVSNGLPGFSLVGFLSSEVKEARERVQIGLKNAGFHFPPKRITINLSPADIRKGGTGYDLAIAVSVLCAFGYFSNDYIQDIMFIGELGLEGKLKEVHGILPRVYTAYENHLKFCVVPKGNVEEANIVEGIRVVGVSDLKELVGLLNREELSKAVVKGKTGKLQKSSISLDFRDVHGQEFVKRAALVAAAGRHNLLMIGPPGSGKTMIAKRIPGILPTLGFREQMEISKIYSVAGLLSEESPYIMERPFRAPHHTITRQALIGGGHMPKPGEVSLSSGGVLFLDELAEFSRQTIEVLRQPLEEGFVNISRIDGNFRYPAECQLVAATNPCRCGFYPDRRKCMCTDRQVRNYLDKISRPMLDRMDLCVETRVLAYEEFQKKDAGGVEESSAYMRERVEEVHRIQKKRFESESFSWNSELPSSKIDTYCTRSSQAEEYLQTIYETMEISARVYHKLLKVARTVADLEKSEQIEKEHIAEAVCYRMIDKKYWGREEV